MNPGICGSYLESFYYTDNTPIGRYILELGADPNDKRYLPKGNWNLTTAPTWLSGDRLTSRSRTCINMSLRVSHRPSARGLCVVRYEMMESLSLQIRGEPSSGAPEEHVKNGSEEQETWLYKIFSKIAMVG